MNPIIQFWFFYVSLFLTPDKRQTVWESTFCLTSKTKKKTAQFPFAALQKPHSALPPPHHHHHRPLLDVKTEKIENQPARFHLLFHFDRFRMYDLFR